MFNSNKSRPLPRTTPEPDQIPGCRWIALTKCQFALVDEADSVLVNTYSWATLERPGRSSYATASIRGRKVYLHRFIMEEPAGMDVDHRDGNGLNCRRTNLRVCSHHQNQMNYRKCSKPTSSRFKGVTWDKSRQLWASRLKVFRKAINLGRFASEEEAARAYDAAARQRFGEFACLNFPPTIAASA